jgi:hypothetical protein
MLVGSNNGTIENSHASGLMEGAGGTIGGLAATSWGDISNSWSSVDVKMSGGGWIGGLVGQNGGVIKHSHESGDVEGGGILGGLVGENLSNSGQSLIANSYATGTVIASAGDIEDVGGFAGSDEGATLDDYSTGNVRAKETGDFLGANVGGFVGNGGLISNSYSTGNVVDDGENSGSSVGGFVGLVGNQISQSYSKGNVTASAADYVGGFAGFGGGIANSFETGNVNVTQGEDQVLVGGFIGEIDQSGSEIIQASYSIGEIVAPHGAGGFAGYNVAAGEKGGNKGVSDCYWDVSTAGISKSASGKKLSTIQLQSGLPVGFSSSIWAEDPTVNSGMPYLVALSNSF